MRGEGGIGKSELARAYLFRHRADYDGVWWVDASPQGFPASVRRLATALRIPFAADTLEEDLCDAVRQAWSDGKRHLVVLDNVEDDREYRLLRPPPPCRALLTTRRAIEPLDVPEFILDVLSTDDARTLLRQRRADLAVPNHDVALDALAEEVGRHTQALALLAAHLFRFKGTPEDLLARLRVQPVGASGHPFAEVPKDHAHPNYALSVEASLSLLWNELKHPAARHLLNLCAFVAPDDVPVPLLALAVEIDAHEVDLALADLADFSIVRREEDFVYIHRLTQSVVRSSLSEECARLLLNTWVQSLTCVYEDPQDHRRFSSMQLAAPHTFSVIHLGEARGHIAELGTLACRVGLLMLHLGRFKVALASFEAAERMDNTSYGTHHKYVARNLSGKGGVLFELGETEKAMLAFREAERIFRGLPIDSQAPLATILNNIGRALRLAGDLKGASDYFAEADRLLRSQQKVDLKTLSVVVGAQASIELANGEYGKSLILYREAFDMVSEVDGEDSPTAAVFTGSIGTILLGQGDVKGAFASFRKTLLILFGAYGARGLNVRTASFNFAAVGGNPTKLVLRELGLDAAAELEAALREDSPQPG